MSQRFKRSITETAIWWDGTSSNEVYPQLQRLWCTSASIYHTPPFSRLPSAAVHRLLLAATKLSPALLGVEVVVPVMRSAVHLLRPRANQVIPVNGPVHDVVAGNKRGGPVEDLGAEAPPGVEDGVVGNSGQRELTVGGDAVRDDALLLRATCGNIPSDRGSFGLVSGKIRCLPPPALLQLSCGPPPAASSTVRSPSPFLPQAFQERSHRLGSHSPKSPQPPRKLQFH